MFRSCDGKKSHDTAIHADAAETTQCAAEDEDVHGVGCATDCRTGFEKKDVNKVQDLGIKLSKHFAPDLDVNRWLVSKIVEFDSPDQVCSRCGDQKGD